MILTVVELAFAEDGSTVIHVDGESLLASPTMQNVAAQSLETYLVTSAKTSAEVSVVRADIQQRVAQGETPVLKSHLDDLGITAAVLQWATAS